VTPAIGARLRAVTSWALSPAAKRRLRQLWRSCHRTFFAFTPADLERALQELGVVSDDVLMVHSAFDQLFGFHGGPIDVIRVLQKVVGSGGTLSMPTIPFRGTAVEHALGDPLFDAGRTPSQMGLITELFRRSPGVVRSRHPTHSVAAWGGRADALIAGHEHADTPCGRCTPYGRLLEYDGKILLLGVPVTTMTFSYSILEELEPRLSFPVFTPERYPLRWKDADGTVRVSNVRLFSDRLDHDVAPLVAELRRRGAWRERRVGRVPIILLRAREVYDAGVALGKSGGFPREFPRG
jgi:aminoglycoside 3-N-acetyltransferase